MKILYLPLEGNTLKERFEEFAIVQNFGGEIQSLTYHQRDTDQELWDLVCDSDIVVVTTDANNSVSQIVYDLLEVAWQLKKPIHKTNFKNEP